MLLYKEKDGFIWLYVNDSEPKCEIEVATLGSEVNWNLFELDEPYKRMFHNVSKWVLHISKKKDVTAEYLKELSELIKQKAPDNKIDWDATFKFVYIIEEYGDLMNPYYEKLDGINPIPVLKTLDVTMKARIEVMEFLIKKHNL